MAASRDGQSTYFTQRDGDYRKADDRSTQVYEEDNPPALRTWKTRTGYAKGCMQVKRGRAAQARVASLGASVFQLCMTVVVGGNSKTQHNQGEESALGAR